VTLLLGVEVVEEDRSLLRLLTPILDDNAGAVDNLACISLAVQDTQTSPLAQLFSVRNLDQGDLVFGAKRNDQLLVCLLLAGLVLK